MWTKYFCHLFHKYVDTGHDKVFSRTPYIFYRNFFRISSASGYAVLRMFDFLQLLPLN